ncbi:saccharopine dehydrogenase [Ferrimonas senticii]|uniref:saccharopine dehydrogenase n=1 Tax=Ferrimonas senticii TaxID=394566 RepID=UPI000402009F|nr:saccharopine dehydrogenase [Ferrimonas senticii]
MNPLFWLRAEVKSGERRSPLTPAGAATLLATGADVVVERSEERIFTDQEFAAVGCQLVRPGSWQEAPNHAYVLGLKELPVADHALVHRHIYFAHVFKGQDESAQVLGRFHRGGGQIFDLEFLRDDQDRRLCAFGYWAGYVGAAVAIAGYYHHANSDELFPAQCSYPNKVQYLQQLRALQACGTALPKVLVIGAKGRCGRGAVELCEELGITAVQWDLAETQAGGPFAAINDFDIMINCAYLAPGTAPFVTAQSLAEPRRLSIISDVSCDPNNPDNPIRIYDSITTLPQPIVPSNVDGVYIQAVDHLPTVLPKESSEEFAGLLLPHLLELARSGEGAEVWQRAATFYQNALVRYFD